MGGFPSTWDIWGSCWEQCCSMMHTLRLLCKFSRADDAVYPSSFKVACSGLSIPSKLAVVLFSGPTGFFPQGKNRLRLTLAWPIRVQCTVRKLTINPTSFLGVFLPYNGLGVSDASVASLSQAMEVEPSQAGTLIQQQQITQWLAHLPLVLEVPGSIPARGEENFGVWTCFP